MEYNTQREKLIIPEYGRNVQKLIKHATTIKDKKERNNVIKAIIEIMTQTNPSQRYNEEFRQKLWDHLFVIADFKLDVDSPYPIPTKKDIEAKPTPLEYSQQHIRYRHYGKNVEVLIEKAKAMKDPKKKKAFAEVIGNYMKMAAQNWHKESTINDEMIKGDLALISDGALVLDDSSDLDTLSRSTRRRAPRHSRNLTRDRDPKRRRDYRK